MLAARKISDEHPLTVARPKMLVAYSMTSTHVQTTRDYLESIARHSGFEASFLHVTHGAKIGIDFSPFDVIFHSYCARFAFEDYVSLSYRQALRGFEGLKVLAVQDEYDFTDRIRDAIEEFGFHIVLTCVPQDSLDYVYPRKRFPNVTFITVFTGYVPDHLPAELVAPRSLRERSVMVGYRGRALSPIYGELGRDKYEIGARMKPVCERLGVSCDIAMDESSRLYGFAWFEFIASCRAMLGSESGSNVFDFDGAIRTRFATMAAENGRAPTHAEFRAVTAGREAEIHMGQISPRVFECAVLRTPMILLRGRYSGALQPDEHYIALERDYSNAEAVLARLNDLPALEAMADRAFKHLVASGQHSYRHFWEQLASQLREKLALLQRSGHASVWPNAVDHEADTKCPMVEVATQHLKTMEDFHRQQKLLNQEVLGAVGGTVWSLLLRRTPRGLKFRLGSGLKAALDARERGEVRRMSTRAYLLVWDLLPRFVRSGLEFRLPHLGSTDPDRK